MNNVNLIGNLTRDVELRTTDSGMSIARFSLAINRGKDKDGNDRGADFPNIVVFGKQAENCNKYLGKGKKVAIQGHLQTGSYEKSDGTKVYTTDVIADRVEFLEWGEKTSTGTSSETEVAGFEPFADEDIPF